MYNSDNELVRDLFPEGDPKRRHKWKRPSPLATQSKAAVDALVKNLESRQLYYIKCIRPNEIRVPHMFEVGLVLHQIRYLLLTEGAKMYRDGFISSLSYEQFLQRYQILSHSTWPNWSGLPSEGVIKLIRELPSSLSREFSVGRTRIFIRSSRTLFVLERLRKQKISLRVVMIQRVWRGYIKHRKYRTMRRAAIVILRSYRAWKIKKFLIHLSRHLPSPSPIDNKWPSGCPISLRKTNFLLRSLHHSWRCRVYRNRLDQTSRNRMREKLTASLIFKDRKLSYPRSVRHPFLGDYIRIRQNVKWKRLAAPSGDNFVVFADIVNKVSRHSGKVSYS